MTSLNDQQIIDNTRIEPEEDHVKMMITLPDGDTFSQLAQNADSAKKHIIAWCDSVRSYIASKEEEKERELEARIAKRKQSPPQTASEPPESTISAAPIGDIKSSVLSWYDDTQEEIDRLGEEIEELKARRNALRDERDKLEPVIKVWRNHE